MEIYVYFAIGLGLVAPSRSYEESIASRWVDFILLLAFFSPALVSDACIKLHCSCVEHCSIAHLPNEVVLALLMLYRLRSLYTGPGH